ncbi:MAG: archaellin/type IV pilin N-terminal domain-containing protein [Chloroflexota bacterium]|nr:archaellin/type IV pilin N-terminal domain-containing protein [Chloroflexota bacterium]
MRNLFKTLKSVGRNQHGITGLETAIILIAFVVVASVFAYTVLSAGIFSSERGKEAVHAGLKQARGSLEIVGGVIATAHSTATTPYVQTISFTVSNALGGEPIDFTEPATTSPQQSAHVVVVRYVDQKEVVHNLYWKRQSLGKDDGDTLLEPGEKFLVTVFLERPPGSDWPNLAEHLKASQKFSLHVMSPTGATLVIERMTPARLDAVMDLN